MSVEHIVSVIVAGFVGYLIGRLTGRAAERRELGPVAIPRPVRRPTATPARDSSGDNTEVSEDVMRYLYAGRKISAIKAHREATGAGLKESKDYVESLMRQYDIR